MIRTIAPDIEQHWAAISPFLTIRNEHEYDAAVKHLDGRRELNVEQIRALAQRFQVSPGVFI